MVISAVDHRISGAGTHGQTQKVLQFAPVRVRANTIETLNSLLRTSQSGDMMARLNQLSGDRHTDKPACTCYEHFHYNPLIDGLGQQRPGDKQIKI